MRAPQFITLARIDQRRFVMACKSGLVHLTWGNATVRLSHDQLRRLATLLDPVSAEEGPVSGRDGELAVILRPDGLSEVWIAFASRAGDSAGSVAFALPPAELTLFRQALGESVRQLDKVLASGIWSQDETESEPPAGPPGPMGRFSFSRN